MRLRYLLRGLPGHPIHPPLTDATIGAYTVATVLAFLDVVGVAEEFGAIGWWLALIVALIVSAPTAVTGFIDWLSITTGTPLWRTATAHMASMIVATVFFGLAAIFGHDRYDEGVVEAVPFVLTLLGFGFLSVGGWIGGTVVYVHGMRVLNLVQEPPSRAVSPTPKPEKELAEGS